MNTKPIQTDQGATESCPTDDRALEALIKFVVVSSIGAALLSGIIILGAVFFR